MVLERLLRTSSAVAVAHDLQKKYLEARASLLRIRSERLRLSRTGWRPSPPGETKLIRAAEWTVDRSIYPTGDPLRNFAASDRDFDLEYRFVPSEESLAAFANELVHDSNAGVNSRVRLRGLEIDEPRFSFGGRPICAGFYDLVLVVASAPHSLVVLPRVESYLEARFWSEVCRDVEEGFGLARHSIRIQVELATVGGIAEAEEVLFELKDSAEAILFDPRLFAIDALKLDSASPTVPRDHPISDPWRSSVRRAAFESLREIATKRGVRLDARPPRPVAEMGVDGEGFPLSLDALRENVLFAFHFLKAWFRGQSVVEGRDWMDFDLVRSVLWTAIHSGFLREENYEAWKDELGTQPFEVGSIEEAALRTLDPLLRTAVFPESAMVVALALLIDREQTRSINLSAVAQNLA